MIKEPLPAQAETAQQRFERILSQEPFEGLKAILQRITRDQEGLRDEVLRAATYEELVGRIGYKLTLTKQIHVQDCYSKMGLPGGIKAVLPYYDIPTQSSLPTLVNSDATLTTTAKGAAFFNGVLGELKKRLSAPA